MSDNSIFDTYRKMLELPCLLDVSDTERDAKGMLDRIRIGASSRCCKSSELSFVRRREGFGVCYH